MLKHRKFPSLAFGFMEGCAEAQGKQTAGLFLYCKTVPFYCRARAGDQREREGVLCVL